MLMPCQGDCIAFGFTLSAHYPFGVPLRSASILKDTSKDPFVCTNYWEILRFRGIMLIFVNRLPHVPQKQGLRL